MATATTTTTNKTQCYNCKKETRTFSCGGCVNDFCFNCLTQHVQSLSKELDVIENDHDQFRQNLYYQKQNPNNDILIQEINKWEEDSIEKIKQTANECRDKILQYTNKSYVKIETKLNELAKQMKKNRDENEFNEIDLNDYKEELKKLNEELNKSSTILIQTEPTKFLSKIFVRMAFNKDTKWKQNGISIAGGNGQGNQLNQLCTPNSICLKNDDQTIYIADYGNNRIVEWKVNATSGRIVAGGQGSGNQTNQLNQPTDVIIDKETNSLLIADLGNRRIMRWSLQDNTKQGEVIVSDIDASRLTMDQNGSIYFSDYIKNEVRRWKRGEKTGTVVAGGNGKGNQLNQLSHPTFIFVDENDSSLYISDRDNRRIMKWKKDAKEGIVVAGGGASSPGANPTQLSGPQGLIVNQLGEIYVADFTHHRVMRWYEGNKEGTSIVGGNGQGKESNQLNHPKGLAFDQEGNLYVVDCENNRIQKYEID